MQIGKLIKITVMKRITKTLQDIKELWINEENFDFLIPIVENKINELNSMHDLYDCISCHYLTLSDFRQANSYKKKASSVENKLKSLYSEIDTLGYLLFNFTR